MKVAPDEGVCSEEGVKESCAGGGGCGCDGYQVVLVTSASVTSAMIAHLQDLVVLFQALLLYLFFFFLPRLLISAFFPT